MKPRIRANLRFIRQVQEGKTVYVVKDPVSLKYFRFGEVEAWLMRRMDGSRSLEAIVAELAGEHGIRASAASLEPFVRRLKEMGLAERTQEERRLLLTEYLRKERDLRLKGHGNTLFRMRFSFGDPDRLFDRAIGRLRFLFTPGFVAFSVAAFVLYAAVLSARWDAFVGGLALLYSPSQYTVGFVAALYVTSAVIILIHELGHGLACKHFGGEVHEIGAMLLYFSPAFYCNVNDAWTFERRAHRLWVTLAGGWIQLLIAVAAAVVWAGTEPGSLVHDVAFIAVLVGGGVTLLLNFNPLIPLDGYYALMDWVEIPNLRPRAFAYLAAACKRRVLGIDVAVPAVTPRERKVFLVYGILSLAYTAALLGLLSLWLGGLLVRRFGAWGWAIVAVLAWGLAGAGLRRVQRVLRVWASERLGGGRARRVLLGGAGGAFLLALALAVLPWTVRVQGPARVEAPERAWVRAADAGRVERIAVSEGERVRAGQALAVLRDPRLEREWAAARAAVAAVEAAVRAGRARGDAEAARLAEAELEARRARWAELERRRAGLTLRAPFDGVVTTPRPEERVGARLAPGEPLLELWGAGPRRVRIALAQRDAGDVARGSPVGIRFPVSPGRTWRTRVGAVSPAAREGEVELLAPLDGLEGSPIRDGMVGRARVAAVRTSVAGALLWHARRLVRLDWFL